MVGDRGGVDEVTGAGACGDGVGRVGDHHGDVYTGPSIAVEAIGAGQEAAISITKYLQGEELFENPIQKKHANK